MRRTLATAGRTVLFSSLTVAGAIASLIVFPQRFLYSMGIGGLAGRADRRGDRADRPAGGARRCSASGSTRSPPRSCSRRADRDARPATDGFWYRLSQLVMRRPGPDRGGERGAADRARDPVLRRSSSPRSTPRCCPSSQSARQVDDVLRSEFPPFRDTPITLAVTGGARRGAARGPRGAPGLDGVAEVQPPESSSTGESAPSRSSRSNAPLTDAEPGPGRTAARRSTATPW